MVAALDLTGHLLLDVDKKTIAEKGNTERKYRYVSSAY